jgi:formimidoylglutamate deiminase
MWRSVHSRSFRARATARFSSSGNPKLPRSSMEQLAQSKGPYVLAPELAWVDGRFQKDVRVSVAADGSIASVSSTANADGKSTHVVALPGYALVPGMVNAHSHAFQRGLRGLGETYPKSEAGAPVSSFWTWREEMYSLVARMTESKLYELTRQCFSEMRDAGITSVGEFHYFHHARAGETDADKQQFAYDQTVLRAARDVGIRVVLLNAYYEHGGFQRAPMSEPQKRFKVDSHAAYWAQMDALSDVVRQEPTQTLGVVAHSMRAVELPDIVKLHEESVRRGLVFHMHLEEQVRASHCSGSVLFVQVRVDGVHVMGSQTKEVEDCREAHDGESPMAVLLQNLKIDDKFTAVHCTWTEADLLRKYVEKKGNVCICPLTEVSASQTSCWHRRDQL